MSSSKRPSQEQQQSKATGSETEPPSSAAESSQQTASDKQRASSIKRRVSLPEKCRSAEDRTPSQPEKKRSQIRQRQRPFEKKQQPASHNVQPSSSESRGFSPASFVEPTAAYPSSQTSPPSEISLSGCETVDVSPLRTPSTISQEKLEFMAESKPNWPGPSPLPHGSYRHVCRFECVHARHYGVVYARPKNWKGTTTPTLSSPLDVCIFVHVFLRVLCNAILVRRRPRVVNGNRVDEHYGASAAGSSVGARLASPPVGSVHTARDVTGFVVDSVRVQCVHSLKAPAES
ncbi:hypothetical protein MRX96_005078 [Rhipicephalus microplus]